MKYAFLLLIILISALFILIFFRLRPATKIELTDKTGGDTGYKLVGSSVYYFGGLVSGADAPTFRELSNPDGSPSAYFRDANHIYCDGDLLVDADVNTFHTIGYIELFGGGTSDYGADQHHVYFFNYELKGADPSTFHLLPTSELCGAACQAKNGPYAQYDSYDATHEYYYNQLLN